MYGPYRPLRYWVQKVLPLVYDESLSYYELLSKVVAKLNEIGALQNQLIDNFDTQLEATVTEVLNEWLESGKISSMLNNLVIVNDYGAKGDGETDDTEAIQRCIDENPNSTIIFKKGHYLISDTISLYGNQGGQTIILGGAFLKWAGGVAGDAAMFHINKVTGKESRCIIKGGTLHGNDRCGCGVHMDLFHCLLEDTKMYDFTASHIKIGHLNGGRSLQCSIKDAMCSMSRDTTQGWSDVNNVAGLTIYEADNIIEGLNTNRTNKGVAIIGQGHEFVNCHFTAEYKEAKNDIQETYAIYNAPYSGTQINSNLFSNCYFDNHKYVIFNEIENRITFQIENSKYFWSGQQVTDNAAVEAFMMSKNPCFLDSDNFTIIPAGSGLIFRPASLSCNANYTGRTYIKERYNKNLYSQKTDIRTPLDGRYLVCGENVNLVPASIEIPSGQYEMIGAVAYANSTSSYSPTIELRLYDRSLLAFSGKIMFNNNVPTLLEHDILRPRTIYSVVISRDTVNQINGVDYHTFYIYIKNKTNEPLNIRLAGTMKPLTPAAYCFLYNNLIAYYADVNEALEILLGKMTIVSGTFVNSNYFLEGKENTLQNIIEELPNGYSFSSVYTNDSSGTIYTELPGTGVKKLEYQKIGTTKRGFFTCLCYHDSVFDVYMAYVNTIGEMSSWVKTN